CEGARSLRSGRIVARHIHAEGKARDTPHTASRDNDSSRFLLPLPEGEGRGEGPRATTYRFPAPSPRWREPGVRGPERPPTDFHPPLPEGEGWGEGPSRNV